MPTMSILITGIVQGVFYRATAKKEAKLLGITGWIRNTSEGNVEAIVTGEPSQLQKFKEWCNKGPDNAKVESVVTKEIQDLKFADFIITD